MRFATLAAFLFVMPVKAQETPWLASFADAKAAAKKDQKVILANFTGSDWCGWCIKLHKEVFSKPEFATWAAKHVVLLELDYPHNTPQSEELKQQNQELVQKFGVRAYPTVLFLDADGKRLGQSGYLPGGPAAWIKAAEEQMQGKGGAAAAEIKDKASADGWLVNHKDALTKAEKEQKAVLANFTGSDWCGSCIRLKDEVFSTPEFAAWAAKNIVLLEIDFPRKKKQSAELKKQNQTLSEQYGVLAYPTIVFLDSKGKKLGELGHVPGGPAAWIAMADKELARKNTK